MFGGGLAVMGVATGLYIFTLGRLLDGRAGAVYRTGPGDIMQVFGPMVIGPVMDSFGCTTTPDHRGLRLCGAPESGAPAKSLPRRPPSQAKSCSDNRLPATDTPADPPPRPTIGQSQYTPLAKSARESVANRGYVRRSRPRHSRAPTA